MVPEPVRSMALPDLGVGWLSVMGLVGALAWIALHTVANRRGRLFRGSRGMLAGILIGYLTLAAFLQVLQERVTYTTGWPLWIAALLGALAVEWVLSLYALERETVTRRANRVLLTAFRVLLVLLVTLLLTQPVLVMEHNRVIERVVAVVLDATPSMTVADSRMEAGERMRLAEALGIPSAARPVRLEDRAAALDAVRSGLQARIDWMEALQGYDAEPRAEQLELERRRLHTFFKAQSRALDETLEVLAEARALSVEIQGPTDVLAALEARLDHSAAMPLRGLVEQTRPESMPVRWLRRLRDHVGFGPASPDARGPDSTGTGTNGPPPEIAMESIYADMFRQLTEAVRVLNESVPALRLAGDRFDTALYGRLEDEGRAAVDRVMERSRKALAGDLLLGDPDGIDKPPHPGLLDRIAATHGLRVYRLDAEMMEKDVDAWRRRRQAAMESAAAGTEAASGPADETSAETSDMAALFAERVAAERALIEACHATDLTLMFEHIARDIPAEQLAAVVLLSDSRHTAGGSPEDVVTRLGRREIPVHTVIAGALRPPVDAAIVAVDAPDTVLVGDRARFAVEIRLDGLAPRDVTLRLIRGSEVIDTKSVHAETDGERVRVELADRPESLGLNTYRIELDYDPAEAVAANNAVDVSVNVTEEPAYLLLVDGRPNWEFRYLKNLFAGRDPWTRLQYVLLDPMRIPDLPEREHTPASVERAATESEATALPESIEEWLKFDVVILGDVAPERLREHDLDALRVFVTERGGTLIVLAGPYAMPHAHGPGGVRDLLPIHALRTERALMLGPEPAFHIRLTPDGKRDPMMRLTADEADNPDLWARLPPVTWRQPVIRVRDGATVLAYAAPAEALPETDPVDERDAARQRELQHAHALIVHHHTGLGNVLFLGFNRTWRLRYRTGDTFHHRFWGQVMRWATAYKMPFGTETIRVGTGQARYRPGESVRIRARLLNPDHSPVISDDVRAVIRRGADPPIRRDLLYLEGSPGIYEADLEDLPVGVYTVDIEAPVDPERMAAFQAALADVPPAFAIEPGVGSEWQDLTPDRGLAGRFAALTGGRLVEMPAASELTDRLGPGRVEHIERDQWDIWNSPWLLALLAGLAGSEWMIRKRERLP